MNRKAKAMNNEMPDEIYVEHSADEWVNGKYVPLYEGGETWAGGKTKYIRADKAVLDGQLIQIDRLLEAVEFRREVAEFAIDRVKDFYGMNKDKPELSLDAILWIAACEYLKLISAAPQPPTKGD